MPSSTPTESAPRSDAADAPARTGWRANVRALSTVITGGRRRTPRASGAPPPRRPPRPLGRPGEQRSLFGEILDWMFAPLLLLWPMSVTFTYLVAQSLASAPHDRGLTERVEYLADHLRWNPERGQLEIDSPGVARDVLRTEGDAAIHFAVRGPGDRLVLGDRNLPLPPAREGASEGTVRLRDDQLDGNAIRVASLWIDPRPRAPGQPPAARPRAAPEELVLLQVAETLDNRSELANEIIKGVIMPQFVVLPLAVLLVWFGLSRGLAPLDWLQKRIRARRPDDLSPIEPTAAPEEMAPLVASFNELLARLQLNLATQRRFIADAAHQMKTPLAGLRTQAELALRETDPDELRRSLRQIAASSERATRLVNQLLALARAEHHAAAAAQVEALDLAELAREAVRDWVPQAIARDIDLGFEGPADDPSGPRRPAPAAWTGAAGSPPSPVARAAASGDARILGVPVLLRELLNNLIDNALRYTPCGGTVTVRVSVLPASVLLEVEDTGPGIPEAERTLVFDRFYRVLGTAVDGSGLGLAIVREIAVQHDALLRVGVNPRAPESGPPGTLIAVDFFLTPNAPPTLTLG